MGTHLLAPASLDSSDRSQHDVDWQNNPSSSQ